MTTPKLLYILFHNPHGESEQAQIAALDRAKHIAQWPGLICKTWIHDPSSQEYGGIYLFQDTDSLQAYLEGPIVASIKAIPGIENFQTRIFDIEPSLSAVTHGLPER